jgi:hypothetical protein
LPREAGGRPAANRGWFRKGFDPRRHVLTAEERRRGGINCARKYTVIGRWHADWHERCTRLKKGES